MRDPIENIKSVKNIIICGAGPAGLATAIGAIKANCNVILIEAREKKDTTSRTQLLVPTPETDFFLNNNIDRTNPLYSRLGTETGFILGTKDIQRTLINKLEQEQSCTFIYGAKVFAVDMGKGLVSIKQTEENKDQKSDDCQILAFDYLIDATGSKHAIASLLNGTQHEITYSTIPARADRNHLLGYFKITTRLRRKFPLSKESIIKITLPNGYMCFVYADRNSYAKSGGRIAKFNVLALISGSPNIKEGNEPLPKNDEEDKILQEKETKEGIEYLKKCLQFEYPMCDIELTQSKKNPKKDRSKLQFFKLNQFEAKTSYVQEGEKIFALAGDSFRTSDFYQNHGLNDAILHGQKLRKVFSGQESISDYNKYCKELSEDRTEKLLSIDLAKMQEDNNFLKEIFSRIFVIKKLSMCPTEIKLLTSLEKKIADSKNKTDNASLKFIEEEIISTQKQLQKLNSDSLIPSCTLIFLNATLALWNSKYNVNLLSRTCEEKIAEQISVLQNLHQKQEEMIEAKQKKILSLEPVFIKAVRAKNLEKIKQLIKEQVESIDEKNHKGNSALIMAMQKEEYEIARELILAHANPNIQMENGDTALHIVAAKGQIELVNLLISNGANVNLTNHYNKTYLYYLSVSIIYLCEAKQYEKIPLILEQKKFGFALH